MQGQTDEQQGRSRARETTDRSDQAIVEMRGATVTFDMERGQSRVLDDVDLTVNRGEVLGVVGESGSGKSMLASAFLDAVVDPGQLTGEITYHPDDGESIAIRDLSEKELRNVRWEEISMVFQGAMSSFNPTMGIREHFELVLEAHGVDKQEGMDRAGNLLQDLHLDPDHVLDAYPHELSGGMQQRALIALSVVLEPKVLVMDEPTAALDLLMQRSILSLINELKENYDLTIVFITHDLPLVAKLADRIGVMYAFDLVELGETERMVSNASHPYTRALIRSTPTINATFEEMEIVEGSSPDPIETPSGCAYHPRCPLSDEQCATQDPELVDVQDDSTDMRHKAACHYWEDAASAVSFDIQNYIKDDTDTDIQEMREAMEGRQ
ncbi:ABC transporter ATP-binding protein [Halomicrobium urmianum]|uniref:ABC transporter ATP-binding protein n=1 Tax=Halomicrobium urmianum TaxID=1586233 RepID=UPI001CDA0AC4|nr:ABC transporter ATP-binding protein [Halomicrobium urmianum]